ALEIWRALQDPRLEPLVRAADNAGKTLLLKALRAKRFSATVRALEAFGEGGAAAMREVLANGKGGRPKKSVTRKHQGDDASYDVTIRVRKTMPAEDAQEALDAARAVVADLERIVSGAEAVSK